MYNSIPKNLSSQDLTAVIHFTVKLLNKHKNLETSNLKLEELPVNPNDKQLLVCNNLLKEIDIEKIDGDDVEIDRHINQLFAILEKRLKSESNVMNNQSKEILLKFRAEE